MKIVLFRRLDNSRPKALIGLFEAASGGKCSTLRVASEIGEAATLQHRISGGTDVEKVSSHYRSLSTCSPNRALRIVVYVLHH